MLVRVNLIILMMIYRVGAGVVCLIIMMRKILMR